MKKENGLTHMTTIFLVIIILVLILVAVRFVELQYKNEESETIKTNMLAIQGKAKIIAEEEKALKKELAGIKISDKKEEENIKKLLEQQKRRTGFAAQEQQWPDITEIWDFIIFLHTSRKWQEPVIYIAIFITKQIMQMQNFLISSRL